MLEFLKKLFCKEKIVVEKMGDAEMILYNSSSTATKVLRFLDNRVKEHPFFYGEERGTIAFLQDGEKHIVPFNNYFIILKGEIFILEERIIEGFKGRVSP